MVSANLKSAEMETMSIDQERLDAASWELQRHFGREGSIYGIKACEEIARLSIATYNRTARAERMAQWIPVSERLPESHRYVLVCSRQWRGVGMYCDSDMWQDFERWQDERSEFIECNGPEVTHWMPLPDWPYEQGESP